MVVLPVRDAAFLYNPVEAGGRCHGATLAQLGSGRFIAVWYAYPDVEYRDGTLVVARRDPGTEWDAPQVAVSAPGSSIGNPVVFEWAPGRLALLSALLTGGYWDDAAIQASHSRDDGKTWSNPEPVAAPPGLMIRHPPLSRADGTWLLPAYFERRRVAVLLASEPPFRKWRLAHTFEGQELLQPVVVRTETAMVAVFRPWSDPRLLWVSRSYDDGTSWSSLRPLDFPVALSGIAAFAARGHLGVVYNHTSLHQRHPLSVAVSADDGKSFTGPRHLDQSTLEVSYPSFLADTKGTVHGLYTFNRRMIRYVQFPAEVVA